MLHSIRCKTCGIVSWTGTALELQTSLCQSVLLLSGGLKKQFKLCGAQPDFI
jgi:glutamine synthetase type III